MKKLSFFRVALALGAPVAVVLSLIVVPMGCGSGGGGRGTTATPTAGNVVVGFTDSPSSGFQRLLLNVAAVRLNPSSDLTLSPADPNWVAISVPLGLGATGELQIDLNTLQGQVKLFNIGSLPAQLYQQVELQIDPNIPGSIVPNCASAPSPLEGCIEYGVSFSSAASNLRIATQLQVTANGLTPLIIDVSLNCAPPPGSSSSCKPPAAPGGSYTINPTLSVQTGSQANNLLGLVKGSISQAPSTSGETVTAVLAGTDTFVANVAVSGSAYQMQLPAAAGGGTAYDLFVAGGGATFAAAKGVTVLRGGSNTVNFSVTPNQTTSSILGQITGPFGNAIQGATVDLLLPPQSNASADCAKAPSSCVVIATANTDNSGNYPMPGNQFQLAPFSQVPTQSTPYTLQVKAAGFDPLLSAATVASASAISCTGSISTTKCSFALQGKQISGNATIDVPPPSGSDIEVLIAAEDSGTGNLENVTLATIPSGATSAGFTLRVPSAPASFDLIATVQDLFEGSPVSFTGHQIVVLSGVPSGSNSVNLALKACSTSTPASGGHGSLSGTAINSTASTTVGLFKADTSKSAMPLVQIGRSQAGPAGTSNAGQFSFCAPPDSYLLQRFDGGVPQGSPVTVTLPVPAAQASPCPSICGSSTSCPGPCSNTSVGNL